MGSCFEDNIGAECITEGSAVVLQLHPLAVTLPLFLVHVLRLRDTYDLQEYLELLEMVISLTPAVSVTWHSVGISLRVATKSVVGDSIGREIMRTFS